MIWYIRPKHFTTHGLYLSYLAYTSHDTQELRKNLIWSLRATTIAPGDDGTVDGSLCVCVCASAIRQPTLLYAVSKTNGLKTSPLHICGQKRRNLTNVGYKVFLIKFNFFFREIMIWSDLFRAIPISAYSSHPAYFSHNSNNKTCPLLQFNAYRTELVICVWRFTLFNSLVYPEISFTKLKSFHGIGAYQKSYYITHWRLSMIFHDIVIWPHIGWSYIHVQQTGSLFIQGP